LGAGGATDCGLDLTYTHPTNNLSYATVSINGHYPETKRVTNLECEEVIFVISGSGTIYSEKGDSQIN